MPLFGKRCLAARFWVCVFGYAWIRSVLSQKSHRRAGAVTMAWQELRFSYSPGLLLAQGYLPMQ